MSGPARLRSPARLSVRAWHDILKAVLHAAARDEVVSRGAGIAFFGVLGFFPLVGALLATLALVLEPNEIRVEIERLAGWLPSPTMLILHSQAEVMAGEKAPSAWMIAVLGYGGLLTAARRGMTLLMDGLNAAYGETEQRSFFTRNLMSLTLTGLVVGGALFALGVIVATPEVVEVLRLPTTVSALIVFGRWPALAALTMVALAVIYRQAPCRPRAHWRWVSPGAVAATTVWTLGSLAFSFYVRNIAELGAVYGVVGGVMILQLWMWLSAIIVLLGAELNAATEEEAEVRPQADISQP